MKKNYEGKIH